MKIARVIKMRTILLKFAGPLQSWGTNSHFETRHTDFHPSKSAVIGVVAASLGYRRDEDDKIRKLNELDFAVRIDQQGKLLRDYHTAKKYKKNGVFDRTYVTNRYYLEDAVFVVAISHYDDTFMNIIENGLKRPYFQPFMGRRSLPLIGDFLIKVTDDGAIESLKNCKCQAAKWYKKRHADDLKQLEIFADSDLIEDGTSALRKDKVVSFSQKERKFGFRYESRLLMETDTVINKVKKDFTDHDIFESIGG